ncbi:hypothetical protein, partial [Ferviditalea candida]|nr:hypothetical protein [Paenibacillaceae bacterium T2]
RQILSSSASCVKDENMRKSEKNEENINLLREVIRTKKDSKAKENRGSKYKYNEEFAEEVIAKNSKQPAQNNPSESVKK